jgi:DNA-binding IclR family transcriptional regulator
MAEVAVPVVDRAGQPLAALCARGDPGAFPEDALRNDVAPHLVRAARAAGRAMADG